MWHAQFSKRDFIEFWLGSSKNIQEKFQRIPGVPLINQDESAIHAYWHQEPSKGYIFPNFLVVPDREINELFVAINANPQALLPISAFCRVLAHSEADNYFISSPADHEDDILPAIVALSMAEAVLHSDGKLNLRNITPATCKRTLSYAWGKALTARVPASSIEKLPGRWLDTYSIINSQEYSSPIHRTISNAISPLSVYAQLAAGAIPQGKAAHLAYAIFRKDQIEIEHCWKSISKEFNFNVSLINLSQSTREERAGYLQLALRQASQHNAGELLFAASAFIATQVAPGSLEHLDLLRLAGNPSIVFWYALFAAIQTPNEVMAGQGGLGYRIYRDIAKSEELASEPVADIAFNELKAIERGGLDNFARKFGHTNEIEIELVPLVTSSFTLHSKQSKQSRSEPNSQFSFENDNYQSSITQKPYAAKAQLEQVISSLIQIVRELPDDDNFSSAQSKKITKRKN